MEKIEIVERHVEPDLNDPSKFRLISDGLYYCLDEEIMKREAERSRGKVFIPYHQLARDRPKHK